jgi:DNA-binding SARP family transcriptional activator
VRRRTLSILAISLVCVVALVVAALAAAPPNLTHALEAQRRLVTEHPNDPAVYNDLGNLLLLAHQPADAETAYRKAVELDPKRTSALFNLGLLLQQRGKPKEALDSFRQVLEAQPEHAWAHYQIGAIYEAGGQESKAVDEYARAFALDPQLAFPEVNPHVVENKLVTEAMLRAYRQDYGVPMAPSVYEDPHRIAALLVPPPQPLADAAKDAAAAKPATPQPPAAGQPAAGQPGKVLRQNDLDGRATGQAGPPGSVRNPQQPGVRVPSNVPRGTRQWERPEPTIQYPTDDGRQQMQVPAPGQVITPPPAGGVYYRPGYQSTGRLNLQVMPDKAEGRG